jgi:short-subunit dehydrogenase
MKHKTVAFTAAAGVALGALSVVASARRRVNLNDRTVLITGGSRGLGLVLARQLAGKGCHLVLLARDAAELAEARQQVTQAGGQALTIACDVRHQDQVNRAVQQALAWTGRIDVLINNAGIIQVGPMEHMTMADFEQAMSVHFYAPLYTTMAVAPIMQRQGGGRIVNITSIGGKVGVPHMLPYVASKFAGVGLSDATRSELRRSNIHVTTVVPWAMRTGSPPNALFKGNYRMEFAWFAILDSLPLLSVDAERAAAAIVRGIRRGAPRVTIGVQAKLAVLLNEICPAMVSHVTAVMNRLLPGPVSPRTTDSHTGWQSTSQWAPSMLTRMGDQATARNNEARSPSGSARAMPDPMRPLMPPDSDPGNATPSPPAR